MNYASLTSFPLRVLIYGYRYALSPLLPMACRFEPSCSHYALEALHTHGPLRGIRLIVRRLLRCHPWGPCGYDPMPPFLSSGKK